MDVQQFLFEASDTGEGIAPEDRDRIFEAFTQSDTGIREGSGTGLGLSISKRLIDLMGGTLDLDSEVGKGSRFYFTIPLPRQ